MGGVVANANHLNRANFGILVANALKSNRQKVVRHGNVRNGLGQGNEFSTLHLDNVQIVDPLGLFILNEDREYSFTGQVVAATCQIRETKWESVCMAA
jgi:hypothetical protein